jgi:hypothetical protein
MLYRPLSMCVEFRPGHRHMNRIDSSGVDCASFLLALRFKVWHDESRVAVTAWPGK